MEEKRFSISRILIWSGFFLFLLLFFVWINFPEYKIRAAIESRLDQALSTSGITLDKSESTLTFFWGIEYKLKDPKIFLPQTQSPLVFDQLSVRISYFPLLLGKISGSAEFKIKNGTGNISFSLPIPNAKTEFAALDLNFDLKNIDLMQFNITQLFLGVTMEGLIHAKGFVSLPTANPDTWESEADFKVISMKLPSQNIQSASFPIKVPGFQISIIQGNTRISQSKLRIEKIQIGQTEQSSQDDIQGTLSGLIELAHPFAQSQADLLTEFRLSQEFIQQMSFLKTLLEPGRQASGSFKYKLKGKFSTGILPEPVK